MPAAFAVVDRLPTTPAGKVDRKALARLRAAELLTGGTEEHVAPRTDAERRLAASWQELLEVDGVSADDDFFALGGHSLLATRLIARVQRDFAVELPLRRVFELRRLDALAAEIEAAVGAAAGADAGADGGAGAAAMPALEPLPRVDGVPSEAPPLSFAQQRLWFLDRMDPGSAAYNLASALYLDGPLRPAALAAALVWLRARHESLRTTFAAAGAEPVQRIAPISSAAAALPQVDLAGLAAPRRHGELHRLARAEARRPFDLAAGPLWRFRLLRLAGPADASDPADAAEPAAEHAFLFSQHHAVSDGWSINLFVAELGRAYAAAVAGADLAAAPPLPPPAVQYADYAVWQRRWLAGGELERQLAFWRRRLAAVPPLELPTDRPRPAVQSQRGATLAFELPPRLAAAAEALARQHGATPFMVFAAGLMTLLGRWSGQRDFALGSPVAGRPRAELEEVVGFFVNTLVLRADLAPGGDGGEPTFAALLARVRDSVLDAHAHQDLPFEKLVEELAPRRDLARTPLFQVMFTLQNLPPFRAEMAGVALSRGGDGRARPDLRPELATARFDLAVSLQGRSGGVAGHALGGVVEYAADLFDRATVERLCRQYRRLLEAAVARPQAALGDLPLLSAAEQHQLVVDWNDTRSAYPRQGTLAELLRSTAREHGERVALEAADGSETTYRDLLRHAEVLARMLAARGVGPEVRVGLFLDRSPEAILAIAAVALAGGAYVPLDPAYPRQRLCFLLADAAPRLLLTRGDLAAGLEALALPAPEEEAPAPALPPVLLLDGMTVASTPAPPSVRRRPSPSAPPSSPPLRRAATDGLAYVMYTSGSTGRPKGVAVTQRGVLRLVCDPDYIDLSPDAVVLQVAPLAFDASTIEIWCAFLHGSRLVLAPGGIVDPAELGAVLAGRGVSHVWLTSGLFHQMVDAQLPSLAGLHQILAGGDVVSPVHVRKVLEEIPSCRMTGGYGPTENTVFTATCTLRSTAELPDTVPLGRPIADTGVLVVDAALRPVPVGVVGEVLATGDGLARGYLDRPGRSAESFVPHPLAGRFGVEPGARAYRTGDLGRWRPDGRLEFAGRTDSQVKVRGYRIELGEVEAALAALPGVGAAVVLALGESAGDKRLVGYVTGAEPAAVESAAALAELRRRLPDYMVPSALVVLAEMPRTANDKIDRRALAELAPGHQATAGYVAPRSEGEEVMAALWAQVLGVERVGAEDDFFALGGHSLLATRLVWRIGEALGVELPVRRVFELRTVAALAVEAASAQRGEIGDRPPLVSVPRHPGSGLPLDDPPLSFAQQRLWFLDRLDPGRPTYAIPSSFALSGPLSPAALRVALAALVRRQESLRTVFVTAGEDDEPRQRVLPPATPPLPLADLAALPPARRRGEAARLLRGEAAAGFDLERGPLWRFRLLRLDAGEHVFLVDQHHVVSDGWSLGVFLRELRALYGAVAAGMPAAAAALPELPVQYADYAAWQRSWLAGDELAGQLDHWRRELAGLPPLELPTDRPRPVVQSQRGASLPLRASAAGLGELGGRLGATPFIVLLAAVSALLGRFSGQRDFAVGSVVAGRDRREVEDLVGFFVNTLVLRADLAGDPTFEQLVERARRRVLTAHAFQDLPFEKLVEELAPRRDLSSTPLFQVMLAVQDLPSAAGALGEARLGRSGLDPRIASAKFDLSLTLAVAEEGGTQRLGGLLEYATDLFDRSTVERLGRHLGTLLEGALAAPQQRLSELPLLAAAERQQLVGEWNDTASGYPRERSLADLFAATVAEHGERVAIATAGGEEITYRQLERRARRLAHRLAAAGVGPEEPVGIFLDRSPQALEAMLAVVLAGGVYVPLDPAYPADRLAFMVEDSAPAALLSRRALAAELAAVLGGGAAVADGVPVLWVDDDGEVAAEVEAETVPLPRAAAASLAYVMYTSGSTGRPKGVAVTHRGVLRLVTRPNYVHLTAGDTVGQVAPLAFDASTVEIWSALAGGCRLALAPADTADTRELGRWVAASGVTHLWVTTGLFHTLVDDALEHLGGVRQILTGGDVLSVRHVRRAVEGLPGCRVTVCYGPTENASFSTTADIGGDGDLAASVPLGAPIADSAVYLLDRTLRPVPLGVTGEIFVAGDGLARGYLGRPGRTAESFLPDPFGAAGRRMYRTGDLGRWLRRGWLEFQGRYDFQVKVRGFRIELGEVQTTLAAHPAVEAAVVLALGESADDKRLVAFTVARDGAAAAAAELGDWLRSRLPPYMVPSAFVAIDAVPLTANEKIDRLALARLAAEGTAGSAEWVAPSGALETAVAEVFGELLEVERVGARDDFFALGGHSLLATRLVSRLRRRFAVEVPVRQVFETPTVAALAAALGAGGGTESPPLVPVPRDGDLPLSFAQQRLWFLDRLEPGSAAYNMPLVFRIDGGVDLGALAAALADLARRQESLRTVFAEAVAADGGAGEPVQRILPPGPAPLRVVDLSSLAAGRRRRERRRCLSAAARRPFDLAAAPPWRLLLVVEAADRHRLLVGQHHIVSDGWSVGVLRRELAELYAARLAGRPPRLPELPVQYADFAVWQRRRLDGAELDRQLAYWRDALAGVPVLQLPVDRPRPAVQSHRGAARRVPLPAPLAAAVRDLSRACGATPFIVLLAAFEALVGRWSGQRDFAVGSPIAGRNREEVEELIGFFVNTLVLRADDAADFAGLLERVRERVLEAHAHQELPFEKLVEELAPQRDLSTTPLFQVMFSLHTFGRKAAAAASDGGEGVAALALRGEDLGGEDLLGENPGGEGDAPADADATLVAKFDLELTVVDRGDDGMEAVFEYARDLFDATTVQRLAGHWLRLLAAAVEAPETELAALPLLSAGERHALLHEANDTAGGYPREGTLAGAFLATVAAAGERPAVVAAGEGGEVLTYRELHRRAAALAGELARRGVGPEVPVGLFVDRSPQAIVALVAVALAGGVYVPLDPDYPVERLRLLVADAAPRVVVTRSALAARWAAVGGEDGPPWLAADALPAGDRGPLPAPRPAAAENLAYVMYTSGTTGRPKGVAVTQRGVLRLVLESDFLRLRGIPGDGGAAGGGLAAGETILQVAPLAFDASTAEIWCALANGCRLVLAPTGVLDVGELGEAIRRAGVDRLWLTSGLFHQMVDSALPALAGVRQILAGGDVVSPRHLERMLDEAPATHLTACYGPTENTTFTSTQAVRSRRDLTSTVPLGRPISATTVYVLDRHLRPVPAGAVGEIWTGGDGLARGYLGQPAATAASFGPHPLAGRGGVEPGARLYRTGDLGRWLADGRLEFAGRGDHQVKVRGYRIELGEVESVLATHPAVGGAVVLALGEAAGDKRLVAFTVAAPGEAAAQAAELADWLRGRMPPYMVPTAFVAVDALPLTANEKIDRAALARLAAERSGDDWTAPRGEAEVVVAELFGELLGVERVGAQDDFFELGGHSLLATRLVSRLHRLFEIEVPVRQLFETPTVAGLAAAVAQARHAGAGTDTGADTGAARAALQRLQSPLRDGLPLSFAQQRLWFLDRLEPGSAAYNMPLFLPLDGEVDRGALAAALTGLARRQESLRTVFLQDGRGEPVQSVLAPAPVTVPLVDLGGLPAGRRGDELRRRLAAEVRRPFDLAAAPPWRFLLLAEAPRRHVFVVGQHHIVSDGWSSAVLLRELDELYAARLAGRPPRLPELPIQYADFAAWQRGWLAGAELDRQLAFWRAALAGVPALQLPVDRPRPPVQSHRGRDLRVSLPAPTADAVRDFARHHGATPFIVLLAAFEALLFRWSGQDDFAVGTAIAGRNREELEGLIGFFVNTLVLRADAAPSFAGLVARVRERMLEAHAHQELPFEKLVEELAPQRDLATTPLFQVMFGLQAEAEEGAGDRGEGDRGEGDRGEGDAVEGLPRARRGSDSGSDFGGGEAAGARIAKFDLELSVIDLGDDGLDAVFKYARDLFDATTVRRLAGHFAHLLAAALAAPDGELAALPWIRAGERHALLHETNDTASGYPRHGALADAFRAAVAAHGEAVALVAAGPGGETLTYRELERRATVLAGELGCRGVGPDVAVGLFVDRSVEAVVAIVAVALAGGVYVPLDPDYPRQRLQTLVADVAPRVVVTRAGLEARWTERMAAAGPPLLLADAPPEADRPVDSALSPLAGPPRPAAAENLAYVMYTSGSTGRPKGVAVTQRGVLRLVLEADYLRLGAVGSREGGGLAAGESILQLAPLAFDASTLEIWGALTHGCRVVLAPTGVLDVGELGEAIRRAGVDRLWLTSGLFHQVVDSALPALAGVRHLLTGGDVVSPRHLERMLDEAPATHLTAAYGPTENTTFTTTQAVRSRRDLAATVPLGRPIADTTVYVLDRRLRPVPAGVLGEIWTGGDGLARGYLGLPAATAASFRPHPFAGRGGVEPGARLYRTGDLGRWLADGRLEFGGRGDHQVKVRGYRIELGEVEGVLAAHPAVDNAVVLALGEGAGDKRLVGYLAVGEAAAGTEGLPEEVADFARQRLPSYMVPSLLVPIAELPRTANDKIDRRALAARAPGAGAAERVAPRTAAERAVAAVFAEVLGVPEVGAGDDFFRLGGHSLLAVRLAWRLHQELGVELPMQRLFEAPTVAAVAAAIEAARQAAAGAAAGAAVVGGPVAGMAGLEPPLSFAQQRLWFLDRLDPGQSTYNVPLTLHLEGDLDAAALTAALAEIGRRQASLRTVFATSAADGEPVQRLLPARRPALSRLDLASLPAARREPEALRLLRLDAEAPFDLTAGPLWRFRLLHLGGAGHELLCNAHHAVSDGWSVQIFLRELSLLYAAAAAGAALPQGSPLADLPVQYADFAVWQRRWLAGGELERQLAYWRRTLAGLPQLELPTDRPRPAVQRMEGATLTAPLPAIGGRLDELARRHGATGFMAVLAALQAFFGRYAGQRDFAVGSPVAGRNRPEIEDVIGFFVNTLVLRADLAPRPDAERDADSDADSDVERDVESRAGGTGLPGFAELLRRSRHAVLEAQAHQDLPFEKLVEELAPRRDLSTTPFFQVLVTHHRAEGGEGLKLGDVAATMRSVNVSSVKFDLAVSVSENPEGELTSSWSYRTDLFDAATVERLARHFGVLLAAAVESPEVPVEELPLLAVEERRQLLDEWGDGGPEAAVGRGRVGGCRGGRERRWRTADGGRSRRRWRRWCWRRRRGRRRRKRWWGRTARRGRTPSWSRGPRRWRSGCAGWGWVRRCGWRCAWDARRGWWRRSSACCRRAAPTYRSTRPTRRRGSTSCWRTRRRPWRWWRRRRQGCCRRGSRGRCWRWTRWTRCSKVPGSQCRTPPFDPSTSSGLRARRFMEPTWPT